MSEIEVMYAYEHTYAGDRTLRHSEATDRDGRVAYVAGREYDGEGRLTARFEGYDDFGRPQWVELDAAQTSTVAQSRQGAQAK